MKQLSSIFFGFVMSIVTASPACAQKPQVPAGPLLKKADAFSAWRIAFSYPEDKQQSKNSTNSYLSSGHDFMLTAPPRKITFIRTNTFWRAVTVDVAGHSLEQWSDGVNEFVQGSDMKYPMLCPIDEMSGRRTTLLVNFGAGDLPDMDWISAETFSGMQSIDSHPCMVFAKGDIVAWVDNETRFPVRWQRGSEVRTFEQLQAPTAMIALPSQILRLSAALKRDREAIVRRPPHGG